MVPLASGFTVLALPIRCWAFEAVGCRANSTATAKAAVHLWLYMTSLHLLVNNATFYEIENQALFACTGPLLSNPAAISRETAIPHLAQLLHWRCDPDHKKSTFRCDGHHKKALFIDLPTDIGATDVEARSECRRA